MLSLGIMRFTPPLCDYSRSPSTWDLQFSSASQLGASMRICLRSKSRFRLREGEPSFKEFLVSPEKCVLGKFLGVSCFSRNDAFRLVSIKLGCGSYEIVPGLLFFCSYAATMF